VNKRNITTALIACFVLGADQATKIWARAALMSKPAITLIDDYLLFAYHENEGVAFSLGATLPYRRVLLVVLGLAVLVFVWHTVRKLERRQGVANVAFALVAGGALGNIIDRIWLGRVIDFIVMHWRHKYYWPAYNVADIALVVGVGLLLIAIGVTSPSKADPATSSRGRRKRRKARGRSR
jgi:signal peptidase II